MIKRIFVFLLFAAILLMSSCTRDEEYIPVKKTGYDPPPLEVVFPQEEAEQNGQTSDTVRPIEENAKPVNEVFNDFSKTERFRVLDEDIIVRAYPSFDGEILKYFSRGEILEVVDKRYDEEGNGWYTLRLFDYGYTYGFAPSLYLEHIPAE